MNIRDRSIRGFVAGLAGGAVMNVFNLFFYYVLPLTQRRCLDWAGVIIYGHLPRSAGEALFALLIQMIFVGFNGLIFAYLIIQITSVEYRLKGILWGAFVWFGIRSLVSLARVPELAQLDLYTVVLSFLAALIYGYVAADVLPRLEPAKETR